MMSFQLGNSGIYANSPCLGTMYFGTKIDEKTSFAILDAFIDFGGNFIDTANNYSFWVGGTGAESETIIGKWMKLRKNRDRIVLASKVGSLPKDPAVQGSPPQGLSKQTILSEAGKSLNRLQTDYLDLYYFHADHKEYPLEERWEAFYDLHKRGSVRSFGSSNIEYDRFLESERIARNSGLNGSTALQLKYSYLLPDTVDPASRLRFLDDQLLAECTKNNISILVYSTLLSGAYERGFQHLPENYQSPDNRKKFDFSVAKALEEGISTSQWVLQWLTQKSPQIVPILGVSSTDQLEENMKAFTL